MPLASQNQDFPRLRSLSGSHGLVDVVSRPFPGGTQCSSATPAAQGCPRVALVAVQDGASSDPSASIRVGGPSFHEKDRALSGRAGGQMLSTSKLVTLRASRLLIPVKPITDSGVKSITESGQPDHWSERSDAGVGL